MTDEDMAKVPGGVQLLPMTAGEIVLGYNLPGSPKGLKLPRDVYAGIFLGKITKWSDPKLKAANPGVNLPDTDITVVRRADSSGTTFVFTHAPERDQRGVEEGPRGGHDGELAEERQVRGLPQERRGHRHHQADARRRSGTSSTPSPSSPRSRWPSSRTRRTSSWRRAAREGRPPWPSVQLPANLRAWVSDPEGPKAYPIATYTWMLFYKENKDPKKAAALRELVEFCLTDGQKMSAADGLHPAAGERGERGAQVGREHSVKVVRAAIRPPGPDRVSRPPSTWDYVADRAFRGLAQAVVWLILLLLALHPLVDRRQGRGGHAGVRARASSPPRPGTSAGSSSGCCPRSGARSTARCWP